MINERDWPKTFDWIDEFFRKCYGIASIPLAYIIRKDATPKEGEETDWDDLLEQMIESAPHGITEANPTFGTENKMLFDKLAELTRKHECWTYIMPHPEPEMAGQPTWPSRTIILGLTTLATWLQQLSTS